MQFSKQWYIQFSSYQFHNDKQVKSIIEQLSNKGEVICTGFISQKQLLQLYASATITALPSLYEGFGLPPLEAMANGTPVVTSNISSLPEVVGDAALTVDPYNIDEIAHAIRRILDHPELRSRLVASGHKRAGLYTWERSVVQVHQAYQQVLGIQQTSSETARATCGSR